MTQDKATHTAFLDRWRSLRKAGQLRVTSEDFLDSPNPVFSPNVLILDVYDDDVVVRLVATAIVERWGVDLTGKSMFTGPLPMKREDTLLNFHRVIDQPCGLLSANTTKTTGGRAVISETLALPLDVLPGRPKRLLIYSRLIDPLTEGERSEEVSAYTDHTWIDIGAGVPNDEPLTPMLAR